MTWRGKVKMNTQPDPAPPAEAFGFGDASSRAGSRASVAASSDDDSEPMQVVSVPLIVPTFPPPAGGDDADAAAGARPPPHPPAAAGPNAGPRSPEGRPVRRPTDASSIASASDLRSRTSEGTSDCVVRRNSIQFRHESDSYCSEDDGSADTGSMRLNEMGVVDLDDLRGSGGGATSLAGSQATYPSVDAVAMFKTKGEAGAGAGARGSDSEASGPLIRVGKDLPRHWADARAAEGREEAYRSLMRMMEGGGDVEGKSRGRPSRGERGSGGDNDKGVLRDGSRSFWSPLAHRGGSGAPVSDDGVSLGGEERSEGSSNLSELSPLSRERRLRRMRRELYVRRCAKAMAVFVALALLSVSAMYFASEDESVFDAFVAGLFGDKDDDFSDQRLLPQELEDRSPLPYASKIFPREEADPQGHADDRLPVLPVGASAEEEGTSDRLLHLGASAGVGSAWRQRTAPRGRRAHRAGRRPLKDMHHYHPDAMDAQVSARDLRSVAGPEGARDGGRDSKRDEGGRDRLRSAYDELHATRGLRSDARLEDPRNEGDGRGQDDGGRDGERKIYVAVRGGWAVH